MFLPVIQSVAREVRVLHRAVESTGDQTSSLLKSTTDLKLSHQEFQDLLQKKCKALNDTEQFFSAAEALQEELDAVLNPSEDVASVQALNPIVVDKLYAVLGVLAEQACASLQVIGGPQVQPSIKAANNCMKEVEMLVSKSLIINSCEVDDDTDQAFLLLNNMLFEIEKDVQEAIDSVSGGSQETEQQPVSPADSTKKKKAESSVKLKVCQNIGKSSDGPRKGTVNNLKKFFETESQNQTERTMVTEKPASPKPVETNTYPPRRRVSTSSTVIEPSSPVQVLHESPVKHPLQNSVVTVKAKKAPVRSTITINVGTVSPIPPPVPPLPEEEEKAPKRPPLPIFSETESDSAPPTPSPPPERPPPPTRTYLTEETELAPNLQFPLKNSISLNYSQSPVDPQSSYCTSEDSQYEVSSSEHNPSACSSDDEDDVLRKEEVKVLQPVTAKECSNVVSSQSLEEPQDESYDEYLSDTSSFVYSSLQNGYYSNRVMALKMEDGIRPRDLSPVIEEADEDDQGDRPDSGLKAAIQGMKEESDRTENLEWVRAHRQSLLSMK